MPEGTGGKDSEPVGTLAEEAAKLFSAVMSGAEADEEREAHDAGQTCPHGWCPVCSTAELVRDHPEVVAHVMAAGQELVQAWRSVVEAATERREQR